MLQTATPDSKAEPLRAEALASAARANTKTAIHRFFVILLGSLAPGV